MVTISLASGLLVSSALLIAFDVYRASQRPKPASARITRLHSACHITWKLLFTAWVGALLVGDFVPWRHAARSVFDKLNLGLHLAALIGSALLYLKP